MRYRALIVVVLMVVAACTSSDEPDAGAGTDGPTTTAATATTGSAAPPSSGATSTSAPEIELTDSYRGVTAETITIGAALVDFEGLNEQFGLDFAVVPVADMYAAWADALNERGGINGREVEVDVRPFIPIGDDPRRVCLELMEDAEVFVVIGQFIQSDMVCITETYGHPYVGHFGETPDRQAESNGLFFATEMSQPEQRIGGTQAMIDAGDFEGRSVAIVWETSEDAPYAAAVRPLLDDAGVEVVAEIEVDALTTDTVSNQAAWDVAIERVAADGADVILNLSGILGVLDAVERAGLEITIAHTNGQAADGPMVLEETEASEAVLERSFAVTTWKPNIDEQLADPGVQRCIDEFEAAFPDADVDRGDGELMNGFTNNCRAFALTVAILEAAGGDITPETFREAGEGIGAIELPAMADGFLSPDHHSAGSRLSRYEYDADEAAYVRVGDPIPTRE